MPIVHHRREVILSGTLEIKHTGLPAGGGQAADLTPVLNLLNQILAKETIIMATVDDIIAKVQAEGTVVDSIGVAVDGAVAKLAELRALVAAGGTDPAKIQAALDAIDAATNQLKTKGDALAAAAIDPPVVS